MPKCWLMSGIMYALATVSSLGAVLYDWKSLKTQRDDGNSEQSSGDDLEQRAEGQTEDKD